MIVSTVRDPEIIARRAAEAEAAQPHQLRCFEQIAENIVEEAADEGIALDGDHDEIYKGMTIINRYHMDLVEGARECLCERAY